MNIFWQILYVLMWLLQTVLIARFLVDWVRVFAHSWMPAGRSAIAVEVIYTATDPPVKLLRRVIPMVRVGGMSIDISLIVLLLLINLLVLPIIAHLAAPAIF